MANWICKQDGVAFPPGLPCCPQCQTRDAFEQGGDKSLNVYDAVEVTGIARPDEAWSTVNEAVAEGLHTIRQGGGETVTAEEARAQIMGDRVELPPIEDDPVAQRLGLVPGGGSDETYREPDRSLGLPDDGNPVADQGESEQGEAVKPDESAGSETETTDTPDAGNATTRSKAHQKDVPS